MNRCESNLWEAFCCNCFNGWWCCKAHGRSEVVWSTDTSSHVAWCLHGNIIVWLRWRKQAPISLFIFTWRFLGIIINMTHEITRKMVYICFLYAYTYTYMLLHRLLYNMLHIGLCYHIYIILCNKYFWYLCNNHWVFLSDMAYFAIRQYVSNNALYNK